jgi:hypothetical protein
MSEMHMMRVQGIAHKFAEPSTVFSILLVKNNTINNYIIKCKTMSPARINSWSFTHYTKAYYASRCPYG